jgi:hybrid cluster-associated redox disulfide protein
MVVDEIMRKWPATVAVVLRYRMHCVGCPIFLLDLESAVQAGR